MKRIILVFGIAAFSSASAQEKELFDIQEHLQKKAAENKKAYGDRLILDLPFENPTIHPGLSVPVAPGSGQSYLLPNGDKVITLSMDNMPCVQPGMEQFHSMPNPGYGILPEYFPSFSKPGAIPNGATPNRVYFIQK
jgi:hypothetical protein